MRIFALRGLVPWFVVPPFLASAPPDPQWITHSNPGYSVQSPQGWTASPDRQKGWVHLAGTQGENVVIWPVFIPEALDVTDLRTLQSIHLNLASLCPCRAGWEAPQAVGPNALRARGRSQNLLAVSVFTWIASPRGTAACFFLAGARETDFRKRQSDLARILGSFRLAGPAGKAPDGGLRFVSFTDSREGAFTLDVPAGWKTVGGLIRSSPFDPHPAVETGSPDGQTRVVLGDPLLPSFFTEFLPGSLLANWPEGTQYQYTIVHRYMTGAYYCRYYVESRIPAFCSDLQITDMKDNPELASWALSRDPALAQTQFTIGSVSFRCREQGRPKVGHCIALTTRGAPMASGSIIWRRHSLLGYVAPAERANEAEAVMARMRDSIQIDPGWRQREIQGIAARSRIVRDAAQEIAGMVESSRRYRDAVDDRIARLRSNATLGVVDLVDPQTGRRVTVDSGADYYWVDHRGIILGTNVDTRPGVDFRRLLELPD